MEVPVTLRLRGLAALALLTTLSACLVAPPEVDVVTTLGTVRAEEPAAAQLVSTYLVDLRPRVLEALPDASITDDLEVWVQEQPALYSFPAGKPSDAEGLWAEGYGRILLSAKADDLERTLAHELVHAALGSSWNALPGSLEEGLCDRVSADLCKAGAAKLRGGRLSSAALACGGLQLELEVEATGGPQDITRRGPRWTARVMLTGSAEPDAHLDVFRIQAGLSSSRLGSGTKRGFYGLSFLVIDRIVERHGLDGLNALCRKASEDGFRKIPMPWLLEAADLPREQEAWRRAAVERLGPDELLELVRMYPTFVVDVLEDSLEDETLRAAVLDGTTRLRTRLTIIEGHTTVDLEPLGFLQDLLRGRLAGSGQ